MQEQDNIQRFMFQNADIRGEVVHLTNSYKEILANNNYPPAIQQLLGETLVAAVLLVATIKFEGTLTIQFYGDEPIRLLVAKCDNQFNIRGLAKFDETALNHQFVEAFSRGKLVVTIAAANNPKPYQSIIPLNGLSISECLENYFVQSEQLATKLWLAANSEQAAGLLMQLLPSQNPQQQEYFAAHIQHLNGQNIVAHLLNKTNETLLQELYQEEDLILYNRHNIVFKCTCNMEKMQNAIVMLGEKEALAILSTNKIIEVNCEYCNFKYEFDKAEVLNILYPKN